MYSSLPLFPHPSSYIYIKYCILSQLFHVEESGLSKPKNFLKREKSESLLSEGGLIWRMLPWSALHNLSNCGSLSVKNRKWEGNAMKHTFLDALQGKQCLVMAKSWINIPVRNCHMSKKMFGWNYAMDSHGLLLPWIHLFDWLSQEYFPFTTLPA